MRFELKDSDFNDFIAPFDDKSENAIVGKEVKKLKIAMPKGDIHFKEEMLPDEMSILEGRYQMQEDVNISGKGEGHLLEIQFNLSDKDISYLDKSDREGIAPANSANIKFLSADENAAKILFQKDVTYNTFDIHLPASFLDRYAGASKLLDNFLEKKYSDESSSLTQNKISISPNIYNVIKDVKGCSYEGLTRRIYLESKTYELIALLYEKAENQKDETFLLSPADKEKIHMAAFLIRENLETPLTILELSRLVGINQTKLKSGFRTLYNTTVFGYMQEFRMHQAKKYLLDTNLPIQEIGILLGYQNISNFSNAFKKIHGYSPVSMRSNTAKSINAMQQSCL